MSRTNKSKISKPVRFAGISLAGGKTDKSAIVVIEYYEKEKKLFLSQIFEKMSSTDAKSSDQIIFEILSKKIEALESIAFDSPLKLPKCLRCKLDCPGYEKCGEPEIKWMWTEYKKRNKAKKPKKLFTPYTERCAEIFIANELEEAFYPGHAMGANSAPLLARALFLKRRLNRKAIEVYPKLSLWRIGRCLGVQKSYLRYHKHSIEGKSIRESILKGLTEKNVAFLYEQDRRSMVRNAYAFDAFLCAITGLFHFLNQCEKRPKGFPKSESWVMFPQEKIDWSFLSPGPIELQNESGL